MKKIQINGIGIKNTKINVIEINPHTYGQLVFDKEVKNVYWGKGEFLHKGAEKTRQSAATK